MKKKFGISLRIKIVGSLIVLVLLSSFVMGIFSSKTSKDIVQESVGKSALNIVNSVVNSIDADKFNQLQTPEDMQTPYYIELHDKLYNIRQSIGLKFMYTMRKTSDGKYLYVVDGTPVEDKYFSALASEESPDEISQTMKSCFNGKEGYELDPDSEWGELVSAYVPIKDKSGKVVGILGADFDATYMFDNLKRLDGSIFFVIVIIGIIAIVVSSILSRFLVKSLNSLKSKAEMIKNGDLRVEINNSSNDEIGHLAQAFKDVVESITIITRSIRMTSQNVFNHITQLGTIAGETNKATEDITVVMNEIADGSQDQVMGIEEVSKSMEEVFNQVEHAMAKAGVVSSSSGQAIQDINEATSIFKESLEKVSQVNDTVDNTAKIIQSLGERSNEISSFSETIEQIAKQTSMLALNAEIEAARAGEQGRGFSVVAGEIKKLAEDSSQASKRIYGVVRAIHVEINGAVSSIENGVLQAREGVNTVAQVDLYFNKILKSSLDANDNIGGILNAIHIIESDCKKTVENINKLSDISKDFSAKTQQTVSLTEEQLVSIQNMSEHLNSLKGMAEELLGKVNKFKTND